MKSQIPAARPPVIRVVHVITGLGVGGAEIMLWRLLSAMDASAHSSVICLGPEGPIAARIRALGVRVEVLNLPADARALSGVFKLRRLIRELRADVVHTWLYHADLLGGLAARSSCIPVVWALHNSSLDPTQTSRTTLSLVRVLAKLSRFVPARIVSCSEVGRAVHEEAGYAPDRLQVIPNGFDTAHFRPDPEFRAEARRLWGIRAGELVVGHVARFHPLKDHRTLLEAAALATKRDERLRFVLYGADITTENPELVSWARAFGVFDRCLFLGPEPNIARRLPGFDLLVSSSISEAFPLVLGEAMASGVACVTTDVGDSGAILGDARRVVPPSDPAALADAIVRSVQASPEEHEQDVLNGITRIRDNFDVKHVAARYRALYGSVDRGDAG